MKKIYFIYFIFLIFFTYFFVCQYISLESPIYDDFRYYHYHQEYINSIELIKNYGFESIFIFLKILEIQ